MAKKNGLGESRVRRLRSLPLVPWPYHGTARTERLRDYTVLESGIGPNNTELRSGIQGVPFGTIVQWD